MRNIKRDNIYRTLQGQELVLVSNVLKIFEPQVMQLLLRAPKQVLYLLMARTVIDVYSWSDKFIEIYGSKTSILIYCSIRTASYALII